MKKLLTTITLVLVVSGSACIMISCVARKAEPIKYKTFTPGDDRVANGERVYMIHCQKCHPGGEGGLGPAINANPAPQFVKRFQSRHGLGVMPGFKKSEISKQDLRDMSKYIRAWKSY
jgi:mono/diheme cytochrome c family protein